MMIDTTNPTIQALVERGYRISAHAYLKPNGNIQVTFAAKNHDNGRYVQGWSRDGTVAGAVRDLAKRASTIEAGMPIVRD